MGALCARTSQESEIHAHKVASGFRDGYQEKQDAAADDSRANSPCQHPITEGNHR